MTIFIPLITCEDDKSPELSEFMGFLSLQDTNILFCKDESLIYEGFLEKLVFRIARKPKSLINHLQRIYYCFQKDLHEQLFAAIVDFLVILNGRGKAISWRMITGGRSRIDPEQFNELACYLNDNHSSVNLLSGNTYSIFSKGFIGGNNIIQQVEAYNAADDPLAIALDHIEYCQLDEAKKVLENAILEHPERKDLNTELLDIYKATRDSNGFHLMLATLIRHSIGITEDWNRLNNYFKGQNNNG